MHSLIKKSLFMLLIIFGIFHTEYAMDNNNNNDNSGAVENYKKQKCSGEYLGFDFDNNYNKTNLKETLLWMLQTHEDAKWNPPLPADPQQRNMPNVPQLLVVAKLGNVQYAESLFCSDVNTNVEFAGGVNALHVAAEHGQTEMVKFLHKKGLKLEHKDDKGITPLLRAAFYGHVAVVNYLLEQNANSNATTAKGFSALELALGNQKADMVAFLCDKGITKLRFKVVGF